MCFELPQYLKMGNGHVDLGRLSTALSLPPRRTSPGSWAQGLAPGDPGLPEPSQPQDSWNWLLLHRQAQRPGPGHLGPSRHPTLGAHGSSTHCAGGQNFASLIQAADRVEIPDHKPRLPSLLSTTAMQPAGWKSWFVCLLQPKIPHATSRQLERWEFQILKCLILSILISKIVSI